MIKNYIDGNKNVKYINHTVGQPGRFLSNIIASNYENDINNNGDRKHILNWSGGTDSTLCLYELCEAYGAKNVIAVTMHYFWYNKAKYFGEKIKRNRFKKFMHEKFPDNSDFTHIELQVNSEILQGDESTYVKAGGCFQAPGWLLTLPQYCDDDSVLYDTSVRNDDLSLMYNDNLIATVDNVAYMLGRKIEFRQPYIYLDKSVILYRLFQENLYEYTWFCETPGRGGYSAPCQHCVPCKTHLTALIKLLVDHPEYPHIDEIKKVIHKYTNSHSRKAYVARSKGGIYDYKTEYMLNKMLKEANQELKSEHCAINRLTRR